MDPWQKVKLNSSAILVDCFPVVSQLPGTILLETQRPSFQERYSYLAWEPVAVFKADVKETNSESLFSFLNQHASKFIVGYLGYELGQWFEKLPPAGEKDSLIPQIYLAAYDSFFQYDHCQKIWWVWFKQAPLSLSLPLPHLSPFRGQFLGSNQSKKTYLEKVRRVLDYIEKGDVYQVNYTQRFYFKYEGSPYYLYLRLKDVQPVSYAAFINTGDGIVISGSPELFLRIKGGKVLTKPMKGTRKRAKSPGLDRKLRQELRNSSKDRAENVMIVDLMRHDLGKFCLPGSVTVPKLFVVEAYTTVYQMVSYVSGKLCPDISFPEIIKSTFPPGSISGAPKKRAMEIIYELEPHMRGVYTGAIGYFWQKEMVLNVAIRTLELFQGQGVMGVGGGIVFDSDPEAEYEESVLKAKAAMKALGVNLC